MKLLSNNEVDEKNPTYILNLDSSFDNTIDHDFRPFHFNMRSSYELDAKLSKDDDLRFDEDSYSLKNTLLLYPWSRERKVLSKLALYGRADMSTHFMDEYTHFSDNKNYIVLDIDGNEIEREVNRSKVRSKIAFFPLRLKEGVGVTYRFPLSPTAALTLRGGYGWQQDYNQKAYSSLSSTVIDGNSYEVYQEIPDKHSKGIESIMIISAGNILKFISINSSMEVFFPFDNTEATTRFENENTISFRVYRNISLDVELDLVYDKSVKDWLQYKSTSKLSLNLIY